MGLGDGHVEWSNGGAARAYWIGFHYTANNDPGKSSVDRTGDAGWSKTPRNRQPELPKPEKPRNWAPTK
eukprot:COSAG03_NODE_29_length_18724_cov_58.310497_3_plen_69_part_00